MSDKIKVMTIVGTRPEIIRLSRVVAVLDEVTDHVLVHTGQNYDHELSGIFFDELGVPAPDHYLEAAGHTAAATIGNTIIRVDTLLEKERPDAVLVLGDTNSCLAVIPAKRRKIPIFHMEAGNRCFDMRVPEETNRRIVDQVSDINLCYSEHARRHLLTEGFPHDRVIKTGSPMREVIDHHRSAVDASDVHRRLGLEPGGYFVVSLHREENVDDPNRLRDFLETFDVLAQRYRIPLLFSLHPRTRHRLETTGIRLHERVKLHPPLGFCDYLALQKDAFCTLSDSGTITEESAILGFPAITLRDAHERPEGMDEGVLIMTGHSKERIIQAVEVTRTHFERSGPASIPEDYRTTNVSWKVVKVILGYRNYIKHKVWFEE